MTLREEVARIVEAKLATSDPALRAFLGEQEWVKFTDTEAKIHGFLYTQAVLEGVFRLADEVDALKLNAET